MVITPISIIKFFKLFSKCELDIFRINSVLDSYDAIYLRKCCSIHLSSASGILGQLRGRRDPREKLQYSY